MTLSGNPSDYLFAFLGGLFFSFTPCVYPLIPISIGYIGIRAGQSKLAGLLLSLAYVTGIALTYSMLGLVASLTGTIFGRVSAHPAIHLVIGIIIILFGLSMLDLFAVTLPNNIKMPTFRKHNYFSAFVLGLGSGLMISPCATPVLGSILLYLAAKKNLFYGTTILLTFAYGMGLILVLAGTFSSFLLRLPKSGKWMLYIKRLYAIILLGVGIYFVFTAIRRF
jgi:thiol:disulfide interchange protein DsbD